MSGIPYKKSIFALISILAAALLFYKFVFTPKNSFESYVVKKGTLDVEVFGIGTLDAKEFYSIGPRITGRVRALYKDQGDMVKKGELLAKIDPVELEAAAKELKAAINKAVFSKNAAREQLEEAKAKNALEEVTLNRYEKLSSDGFVSQAELDAASFSAFSSRSRISSAKALLDSANAEISRLENSLAGVNARIKELSLRAPADLLVLSRDAETGETIVGGKGIFRLVDIKSVWIKAYVDERSSGGIRVGQSAKISLRSAPEKTFSGVVKRISPISDLQTEEREINVAFDKLPTPFYINEQAEVRIVTKSLKDVLKVPVRMIVQREGKKGVWSVKEGRAYFKEIKIIEKSLDAYAAIEADIVENETILVPDSSKRALKDGMRINL